MILNKSSLICKLYFLFILAYQTYFIYTYNNEDIGKFTGLNLGFGNVEIFDFIIIIALFIGLVNYKKINYEDRQNKIIYYVVYIYLLYQVLILVPYCILIDINSPIKLFVLAITRMYFISIPVFALVVFPSFERLSSIFVWVNISSLILLFAGIKNYVTNEYFLTNTGEIRMVYGGAAIIFVAVFFLNVFSKNKSIFSYIFMFSSLIGLICANHRSAYIYFGIVFVMGLWYKEKGIKRLKIMFSSFLFFLGFILILSNSTFLWSTFYGRITKAELRDENAQDRFMRWKLSFDYFLEHPINGSMFKNQYYPDSAKKFIAVNYSPHNFIFEILSTQGIVGFIFYIFILGKSISIGFRNRRDLVSYQMLLILLFYILYSTFNGSFFDKYNVLILVMCISILLLRNNSLRNNNLRNKSLRNKSLLNKSLPDKSLPNYEDSLVY